MKKNSTVKSFIKKVVSRSPRSAFFSHVFFRLTSICLCLAVAVSAMAIPASAETELVKITLTVDDLYNLASSSFPYAWIVQADPSGTLYPFSDIQNPIEVDSYGQALIDFDIDFFTDSEYLYFYYPTLFYPAQGSSYQFVLSQFIPFPYKFNSLDPSVISLRALLLSNSITLGCGVSLMNDFEDNPDGVSVFEVSTDTAVSSTQINWNQSPLSYFIDKYPALQSIVSAFNNPYLCDYQVSISSDAIFTHLNISCLIYGLDTPVLVASPLAFGIGSFDVYVEQEIAPDVEQYLDLIAGPPTAENQTKINNLKQKFESIDSDLEQSAQDMEVEIPDISNKLYSLPQEVVQGNSMVSTNIYTPMLNIPFVTTIFTALFSFLALKLILHGGGKK